MAHGPGPMSDDRASSSVDDREEVSRYGKRSAVIVEGRGRIWRGLFSTFLMERSSKRLTGCS